MPEVIVGGGKWKARDSNQWVEFIFLDKLPAKTEAGGKEIVVINTILHWNANMSPVQNCFCI